MYMDKGINNNGYEYIDLGLPFGTLWAACNVGASKPFECGLYKIIAKKTHKSLACGMNWL